MILFDMHEELETVVHFVAVLGCLKYWMCCCGVYKLCCARESSIHIADKGKRP